MIREGQHGTGQKCTTRGANRYGMAWIEVVVGPIGTRDEEAFIPIAEDGKVSKEPAAALAAPARKKGNGQLAHFRPSTAVHVIHHQLQLQYQYQHRVVCNHLLYQSERGLHRE